MSYAINGAGRHYSLNAKILDKLSTHGFTVTPCGHAEKMIGGQLYRLKFMRLAICLERYSGVNRERYSGAKWIRLKIIYYNKIELNPDLIYKLTVVKMEGDR